MGFFNDLGKKASEAYSVTKEKTTKLSGELKLKSKIGEFKSKIEDYEYEIGVMIYEEFKNQTQGEKNPEIIEKCEAIAKLEEDIKQAQEEILKLKNIKKCVSCGAELASEIEFCSKCGTKQPELQKEEAVEEVVENEEKTVESSEDKKEENKEE